MKKKRRSRLKRLLGPPRRFIWNVFRPHFVRANLAKRSGACHRCGACCQLVWKCHYFTYVNGIPSCKIYHRFRPRNCSNFPIDHHDLKDRNAIRPDLPCGFSWDKAKQGPCSTDDTVKGNS